MMKTSITLSKLVVLSFLFMLIFTLGFFIGRISIDLPSPIFTIDSGEQYQISKLGENFWISNVGGLQNSDAMKISGSCQDLTEFIDKPVQVDAIFTTRTGEHTYFITGVDPQ